jgi:curved DNA-binding protein CbpA
MDTLYDLLGALPQDDAEGLRTAFRKAVKGAHPDLRPDDPDAGMRFRQIVRANDILLDRDQRAVYDHLLGLAQQEKDPASAHPIAARVHKIASGVLAFASVSVVTVGGYLLFMHMSVALVAPTGSHAASHDLTTRLTASIAAFSSSDTRNPAAVNAFKAARAESPGAPSVANAMAMAPADGDNASAASAVAEPAADHANAAHTREVSLASNGDIGSAVFEPEQATQLETKFITPYVDRGLLFFRDKSNERAFPDLTALKRTEKPGRAKSVVVANGKTHADTLPKAVPLPAPRTLPHFVAQRHGSWPRQEQWYTASGM